VIKLLTLSVALIAVAFSAELHWQKDLNTALTLAKKEHKNLMIMVESQHCRWCKKMKYRTLSDEKVIKRLTPYILAKVTREDKVTMSLLPKAEAAPTIFFMTEEKKVIESVVGYFIVGDFLSYIDDVEKKYPLKK